MRRLLVLVVTLAAGAAAVLALAGLAVPVGAQDGGDGEDGRARTAELRFRVVDLGVRSAATDDSEQTTEMPDHTTITYAADVLFDFDRSDLNSDARRLIGELADELTELGPRTVTIHGHTDDVGEPTYNQRLSERRAEAVRTHLAVRLDDEFRLEAAGYGEARPVAPNDTDEGRARNRRVVISYPTG
jgi:outer membrane protein OmpA-like peptidoglycan-associated protein